jgi:3-deoxy-manno-octulosonate cytidylyltransferase (CMP-KDO synthetase)
MSFIAIIPARMASTRLPDKPLLDIGGKPMVVRTAEQALRSKASRVIVATDDPRVQAAAAQHGLESVLTRADHPTGTDRLAEAVTLLQLAADAVIVNVQGDEPLIDPNHIDMVADLLISSPDAAIATCATPVTDADALFNPNVVKVVRSHQNRALYFSRAPIPWARDGLADGRQRLVPGLPALRHIGLYAYRTGFLQLFPNLPIGPLESFESLEQLRALENGYHITLHLTDDHPPNGVDTPEDLARVRDTFKNRL